MKLEIIKFDNLGRGIAYDDDKIVFVPKAIPGDIVTVVRKREKKNFLECEIKEIIKPSKLRKEVICPYFSLCGGCDLMQISTSEKLEFKLNLVNELLHKNKIDYVVKDIIKNNREYNYRNKITLKIVDGLMGYYENLSHKLVPIDYCYLANDEINNVLKEIKRLNIQNGEVTIRCNYKNELLIIKIACYGYLIDNFLIAVIIVNDECLYGDDYFIEKINDYVFKVSYNSFFQVNPFICSKLFNYISSYTSDSKNVLDLYCGVGTLSIVANHDYLLGVEIVDNAIKDANLNKNFNLKKNIDFICSDTKNVIDKITSKFDAIILDPPRSGVDEKVLNKIKEVNIKKIIYVSCNPLTLVRDLTLLKNNYRIEDFMLLDMFPNTHHVESLVVLNIYK